MRLNSICEVAIVMIHWSSRIVFAAGLRHPLGVLLLLSVTLSTRIANASTNRVLLPIEILGANGTTASRTVDLQVAQAEAVRSLWLQVHRLRYAEEASVQVNSSPWISLNNNTVNIAEPGKSFGGIGGGFATLTMTLALPSSTVVSGTNTVRFRFNKTDGVASGYRVLALNFLTDSGRKILPAVDFVEDAPEAWTPPLPDAASIQAGRELWHTASLVASSLPNSPSIKAHCADCHTQDGRDLKYFNFSNVSIITRSSFHGLSARQGEQIASYIRSLPLPSPGRPWNPPYQPGPGLDEQPISHWAAGAGLAWVLNQDVDGLPYLLSQNGPHGGKQLVERVFNITDLAGRISPDIFRPDGNLNPREIPIALQLPDWSEWLPRVHPKDAWGSAFTHSDFAALYDGETAEKTNKIGAHRSLRGRLIVAQASNHSSVPIVTLFVRWSQSRRTLLKQFKVGAEWSSELTNRVYSTQLWQLVKTWEMMQEFGLEGMGRELFGPLADSRTWCNTIPANTAPSVARIPDGPAGVGGSALTNEYASTSWYELQVVLNSGHHQHRNREPLDWVYLIKRFRDLYTQTNNPEPVRLLITVIKALQSTDPHIGPDDLGHGWRPDQNIDPRIMVSPLWAPIFKPLPHEVYQALTSSLLSAWMDKNQQYSVAQFLPIGLREYSDYSSHTYDGISGGKVWEAAQQFRDAGVRADLVQRLQQWGVVFTDRAGRIRYEGY